MFKVKKRQTTYWNFRDQQFLVLNVLNVILQNHSYEIIPLGAKHPKLSFRCVLQILQCSVDNKRQRSHIQHDNSSYWISRRAVSSEIRLTSSLNNGIVRDRTKSRRLYFSTGIDFSISISNQDIFDNLDHLDNLDVLEIQMIQV